MTGATFLHASKRVPDDERVDTDAPICKKCNVPMWLTRVDTRSSNRGRHSMREYECKVCGAEQTFIDEV